MIVYDDYTQDPDYEAGYAAGTKIAGEFGDASETFQFGFEDAIWDAFDKEFDGYLMGELDDFDGMNSGMLGFTIGDALQWCDQNGPDADCLDLKKLCEENPESCVEKLQETERD